MAGFGKEAYTPLLLIAEEMVHLVRTDKNYKSMQSILAYHAQSSTRRHAVFSDRYNDNKHWYELGASNFDAAFVETSKNKRDSYLHRALEGIRTLTEIDVLTDDTREKVAALYARITPDKMDELTAVSYRNKYTKEQVAA